MQNLVKTTLTIPEELLQQAKITAIKENTTLSQLVREGLFERVQLKRSPSKSKDPMRLLGKFSLGINKIYNKRSDLYDEHIKRKMGL